MKNRDGNVSLKISIFSWDLLHKYWYQIYIYTEGSIDYGFFNETFLVKRKVFLYDVIIDEISTIYECVKKNWWH